MGGRTAIANGLRLEPSPIMSYNRFMSNPFQLPTDVSEVERASNIGVGPGVVDRIRKMLNWKFGCTATTAFALYGPEVKRAATLGALLEIARSSGIDGLELAVFRLVAFTANEPAARRRRSA